MPNPLDWLRRKFGDAVPPAAEKAARDAEREGAARDRKHVRLLGQDRFPLPDDHPLHAAHLMLDAFLEEFAGALDRWSMSIDDFTHGASIAALEGDAAARMAVAADERWRHMNVVIPTTKPSSRAVAGRTRQHAASTARDVLLRRKQPFTDEQLVQLVRSRTEESCPRHAVACAHLVQALEGFFAGNAPSGALQDGVARYRSALARPNADAQIRKMLSRLDSLLGREVTVHLDEAQPWVVALREEIAASSEKARRAWTELIAHAQTAAAGKPNGKWTKTARGYLDVIGDDAFESVFVRCLGLVDTDVPVDHITRHGLDACVSQDAIKGLCWAAGSLPGPRPDLARALSALVMVATRSAPGVGIRSPRVCNAAIWALGSLEGLDAVGQLAVLAVRVRYRTARKGIDKALGRAAERAGLPRDEIEEMAVPAYGLTEVGLGTEELGEFRAELRVTGTTSTTLTWSHETADGKRKSQKSVPAAVKRDHADALKDLKGAAKDIQKMLPAQRDRIDALFLSRRTWPVAIWRERYLDHPLVGTLARRIIWTVTSGGTATPVCWSGDGLVGVDDTPLGEVPDDATVALWHPIERDVDQVLAWREWLERHGVVQPFKQAHREVYVLTDAERTTGTYSNRFAAHVLKQHQFNALCAVRGWHNRLRLMVDDEYPPATRELPEWGLRAEFWVEGIGDDYQVDANENGVYLRIATDQVRFYPIDAATRRAHAGGGGYVTQGAEGSDTPLPLSDVPSLVLSEILRDVDLFVGVASVGNDPTWQDGGPEGRYRTYWESYSFGDLSGTARTRKALLERLVPRLRIAKVCTVTDRFLEVQGRIRGYRIHLGSGNILMTPNDQYLCIVPGRGEIGGDAGKVMLPFEGDRMLSVILSKAFLLAADDEITDRTITSQLRR